LLVLSAIHTASATNDKAFGLSGQLVRIPKQDIIRHDGTKRGR